MGYNNQGGSEEVILKVLKDEFLGGGIEARCRLIDDQNSGPLQNRPRGGEALALAPGELAGARSDPFA